MSNVFGRKQPRDRMRSVQQLAQDAQAIDDRRQAQISNQIDSINRLLKNGSYDEEMAALHQTLADRTLALAQAERRIKAALECYGPLSDTPIGKSRWRNADEFLIAIRRALTDG